MSQNSYISCNVLSWFKTKKSHTEENILNQIYEIYWFLSKATFFLFVKEFDKLEDHNAYKLNFLPCFSNAETYLIFVFWAVCKENPQL